MSRVVYENGKLFLSLTRAEVEEAYQNIGRPLEIDIGQLKVLHEDVSKCVSQHWSQIQVYEELSYLRKKKIEKK
jgi:hypothetical protein|tara:strand:- start:704 stop:925 length:222 start_codon:yes stop_codon:yes gene_type:complete